MENKILAIVLGPLLAIAIIILAGEASAHGGRVDSKGGHKCTKSYCATDYHYHNKSKEKEDES